jgi:insulysin
MASARATLGPKLELPTTCTVPHWTYTLANGVRIVIAQDTRTSTSAAAGSVAIGSHADVPELPGLAHLCEHMLFLGTKKTPTEDAFNKFVSQHAGHTNAWTEDDLTNYYFTIANGKFVEALEEFVWFFTAPTMTESGLEREVLAVHSEDEKNHANDYWCMQEIQKECVLSPAHPRSRYGNGNRATLWDGPRAAGVPVHKLLWEFYNKHYVAENFVLSVVSNQPPEAVLDVVVPVLEKMRSGARAVHSYVAVPKAAPQPFADTLVRRDALGRWVNVRTNGSRNSLELWFPVPSSPEQQNETLASHYLSHLLGHECKGTLLDVLKDEDLATGLNAGGRAIDDDFEYFAITATLTQKGAANVDRVVDLMFEAVQFIAEHVGAADDVYDEIVTADRLKFAFEETGSAHDHACTLSRSANLFGLDRAWSAADIPRRFDKAAVGRILQVLRDPRNAVYVLRMPDVDAAIAAPGRLPTDRVAAIAAAAPTQVSVHHKARYGFAQIDAALLDHWSRSRSGAYDARLTKPRANPYLSSDLTVKTAEGEAGITWGKSYEARYVQQSARGTTLWRPDAGIFKSAKAVITVDIKSPVAYAAPLHRFYTRVLSKLLQTYVLAEDLYFAELGAYSIRVIANTDGLCLAANGPSEKIEAVVSRILGLMVAFFKEAEKAVMPDQYAAAADAVMRDLKSVAVQEAFRLTPEEANLITYAVRWQAQEIADSAERAGNPPPHGAFVAFVQAFAGRFYFESAVVGNVTAADAAAIGQSVAAVLDSTGAATCAERDLPPSEAQRTLPSRAELAAALSTSAAAAPFGTVASMPTYNVRDTNCCTAVWFQVGALSKENVAIAAVLASFYGSAVFSALRTNETLGYVVSGSSSVTEGVVYLKFLVQSAERTCLYLLSRVVAFIEAFVTSTLHLSASGVVNASADVAALQRELDAAAESVAAKKTDYPKSLNDLASRVLVGRKHAWGFDYPDVEAAALREPGVVTVEKVHAFVRRTMLDAATARPLVVFMHGAAVSRDEWAALCAATGSNGMTTLDVPEPAAIIAHTQTSVAAAAASPSAVPPAGAVTLAADVAMPRQCQLVKAKAKGDGEGAEDAEEGDEDSEDEGTSSAGAAAQADLTLPGFAATPATAVQDMLFFPAAKATGKYAVSLAVLSARYALAASAPAVAVPPPPPVKVLEL